MNSIYSHTIEYFNARSIKNKLPDLHKSIYGHNSAHIFCITESWLNDSVTDSMLDPKGCYTVYRFDRLKIGGGVVVLINKIINTERIYTHDHYSLVECV